MKESGFVLEFPENIWTRFSETTLVNISASRPSVIQLGKCLWLGNRSVSFLANRRVLPGNSPSDCQCENIPSVYHQVSAGRPPEERIQCCDELLGPKHWTFRATESQVWGLERWAVASQIFLTFQHWTQFRSVNNSSLSFKPVDFLKSLLKLKLCYDFVNYSQCSSVM